jgi:hypothetical protein
MKETGWPFDDRPPAMKVWEVYKTGRIMLCEMNPHPRGWEVRCYLSGEFHYSRVSRTRQEADEEAAAKKQELLDLGWTDRPTV